MRARGSPKISKAEGTLSIPLTDCQAANFFCVESP